MKAGIIYSDRLTTVSPGYCAEIKSEPQSFGMSALLEQRQTPMVGILNGIDTDSYDPSSDGVIPFPYQITNLEEKKKNRTWLRNEYGLPDSEVPLVIMVTRLEYIKGIDLILKALLLLKPGTYQLFILGSGNPYYQGMLSDIAVNFKETLAVDFHYSSALAKKVYAAGDICLMPSKYEPCGLGQLYAMRYGTVPVVNPVGGLQDTVTDDKNHPEKSSGFYMEDWSGEALAAALKSAIGKYGTLEWKNYMINGMNYDSTWKRSVIEYLRLYHQILDKK
jgi:starch synthase